MHRHGLICALPSPPGASTTDDCQGHQRGWSSWPRTQTRPRPRWNSGCAPGRVNAGPRSPACRYVTAAPSATSTRPWPTPPRSSYAACATSAPPTTGSSRSTAPATTTTTNRSSPPACPSVPASKPSTPPAASTSTTPPHGPDPRRTYGSDHLARLAEAHEERERSGALSGVPETSGRSAMAQAPLFGRAQARGVILQPIMSFPPDNLLPEEGATEDWGVRLT